MKIHRPTTRNPGPSWGYRVIAFWERVLPAFLFRIVLGIGTAIGMAVMKEQRAASREFWLLATGERQSVFQCYRHFRSFMDGLVLKLQAGREQFPSFSFAANAHSQAFEELCRSSGPAIFGTFHVGHSDMLGCMLRDFDRKVCMVRLKVGNSYDTDQIERIFRDTVRILWINDYSEFLFSLKDALQGGESIAIQCDRTEYSSRTVSLSFFGEEREFPMTIYYLAHMFQCPVVFAFTGPLEQSRSVSVFTSKVFQPLPSRKEHLAAAARHYQEVIQHLEEHLTRYPELWFNFIPMDNCYPLANRSKND